ncbi:MAG: glutamyl-tRNA reductase [Rhizobiales bacterium]|nr:glutamyl-tRNA reductase [Hyphomicrobiales bacterium]
MSGQLGLIIEVIVGGLLVVTISYCVLLDRRLRAVRADEAVMRKTIADLSIATDRAERAIDALKHTLGDCDRTLGERLRVAERYTTDLEDQIRSGDDVLNRISRIVSTALDSPIVDGAADPAAAFSQHVMKTQPAMRSSSRIAQTLAAAQALATRAGADKTKREGVA